MLNTLRKLSADARVARLSEEDTKTINDIFEQAKEVAKKGEFYLILRPIPTVPVLSALRAHGFKYKDNGGLTLTLSWFEKPWFED